MTEHETNPQPMNNDEMTVCFSPALMQSMADLAARKKHTFLEMQESASSGDPEAEYELGLSYYHGMNGAPEDDSKAVYWLSKAA